MDIIVCIVFVIILLVLLFGKKNKKKVYCVPENKVEKEYVIVGEERKKESRGLKFLLICLGILLLKKLNDKEK